MRLWTHICEKYIALLRKSSTLAVLIGVCVGINPNSQHQNILRILFGNRQVHNRCRIIGGSEQSCYDKFANCENCDIFHDVKNWRLIFIITRLFPIFVNK